MHCKHRTFIQIVKNVQDFNGYLKKAFHFGSPINPLLNHSSKSNIKWINPSFIVADLNIWYWCTENPLYTVDFAEMSLGSLKTTYNKLGILFVTWILVKGFL